MRRNIIFFLVAFFLIFLVFGDVESDILNDSSGLMSLKIMRIDGYQIEVFGFWGDKPSLLKKIFSKKDRDFKIAFENLKTKIFSYRDLDAIIEEINGELKNIYKDGGKIKIIKIRDR